MQGQRRLTGAFRSVDFDDAPHRQTANAKGNIQPQRAGRTGFDLLDRIAIAQLHNRSLAELPLNLGKRAVQRLLLVTALFVFHGQQIRHNP